MNLSSNLKASRRYFLSNSLFTNPNVKNVQMNLNMTNNPRKLPLKSLTCAYRHNPEPTTTRTKLQLLISEFKSLTEPIDRVKRLLDYAVVLPVLDESARVQANKVAGCAAQVWLEVVMDEKGKIWFRADSDSEITKGFCSCLIVVLDGAEPEEILSFKTEDLTEMNVGIHQGKAPSRVNTWQNVLISMKERTNCLVAQREGKVLAGC